VVKSLDDRERISRRTHTLETVEATTRRRSGKRARIAVVAVARRRREKKDGDATRASSRGRTKLDLTPNARKR
jgi:hypothetical protein